MYGQWRDFLLLMSLAAAAATPASGQAMPPAVGPSSSGTQAAASILDFSGLWSHPSLPGFEPPLSGPGPVTNRSRRPDGKANVRQMVGDYTNPILKPQAADVVKKHGEISLAGVGYPTPGNQCWPGGVPFMFASTGTQLLQQPDKITILYIWDHEFRQVRMNQPHPAQVMPSWYGDSVGRYEGDTLVIDTVGIKIGPVSMADSYGTPYTQALHVVERYRLLDYGAAKEGLERDAKENVQFPSNDAGWHVDPDYRGKHLQLQFTVEDDGVFTMPWSATVTYRRALGVSEWLEIVCAENTKLYPGKNAEIPTVDKPDF
jgi:hypothetical protein